MRIAALLLSLLATPAFAIEDLPRFKVSYYFDAYLGTSPDQMRGRLNVVQYLAGVRDLLWWQCEYEVTIEQLLEGANFQLKMFRTTMDDASFDKFIDDTPFGDMVFLSLGNEHLYGKPKPCSK